MGKKKPFNKVIADWSPERRIALAKEQTRVLTDRVQEAIKLHASNEIIHYSDVLSKQIPRSHAARAFCAFQDAQFKFEIIALLSVWDRADDNAISILSVIELIEDPKVLACLVQETFDSHASIQTRLLNPSSDPEHEKEIGELLASSQLEFAEDQSRKASGALANSIKIAKETVKREQMASVQNVRNHVSHSLSETRLEQKKTVQPMKYGDETALLNLTVQLIEELYLWVNGTSFDISGDIFERARQDATELWHNCIFNIPTQ